MAHKTPHDLLSRYETSDSDTLVKARQQSTGKRAESFFDGTERGRNNTSPDQYQTEFTPREPGNKEVMLSGVDDDTMGRWLPKALQFYSEMAANPKLTNTNDGVHTHIYNARDPGSWYTNQFSNTPGVIRQAIKS